MFSKHVHQRYECDFSCTNQVLAVANHLLVLLDAPGIVDKDYMHVGHSMSFEEWIPQVPILRSCLVPTHYPNVLWVRQRGFIR